MTYQKRGPTYKQLSKTASFIEINGKRYDAISGQLIGVVKQAHSHVKQAASGQVLDGFVKKATKAKVKHAHHVHRRRQPAKTLMRAVVSKPNSRINKSGGSIASTDVNKPHHNHVIKSSKIKRFNNRPGLMNQESSRNHANLALVSGEILSRGPAASSAAVAARHVPSMVNNVSHQRLERLLDEALLRADAHKQNRKRRKGQSSLIKQLNKWVLAVTLFFLLIVGSFMAWRYIPHASMRVATLRANISASLPSYVPSGFKTAGPISYKDGAIHIPYKGDDGRFFTITQQASNWNSAALESNALADQKQVQTSQVKGATVYIYDADNHATWVTEGIRYTIQDDAQLTADQLLKIAESL